MFPRGQAPRLDSRIITRQKLDKAQEKAALIGHIMAKATDRPLSATEFNAMINCLKTINACLTDETSRQDLRKHVKNYIDVRTFQLFRTILQHKIPLDDSDLRYQSVKQDLEEICREDIPKLIPALGKIKQVLGGTPIRESKLAFPKIEALSVKIPPAHPDNITGENCIRVFAKTLENFRGFLSTSNASQPLSPQSLEYQAALNCLDVLRITTQPPTTPISAVKEFGQAWENFYKQANFSRDNKQDQDLETTAVWLIAKVQ